MNVLLRFKRFLYSKFFKRYKRFSFFPNVFLHLSFEWFLQVLVLVSNL